MTLDEDKQVLAAEYVLGTLDAEERARVDDMMRDDPDFAAAARHQIAPDTCVIRALTRSTGDRSGPMAFRSVHVASRREAAPGC